MPGQFCSSQQESEMFSRCMAKNQCTQGLIQNPLELMGVSPQLHCALAHVLLGSAVPELLESERGIFCSKDK